MRREDLFLAIGKVEDDRLIRSEERRNPSAATGKEDSKMKTGKLKNIRRIWLIAAVLALMTLLMGSAIAELIEMRAGEINIIVHKKPTPTEETGKPIGTQASETPTVTETHSGEIVVFEEVQNVFIELGPFYPQSVPEGYSITFVSEGAPYQEQSIVYQNEAGSEIRYRISVGGSASGVEIYDIVSKTDVKINGNEGTLYQQAGNSRTLVWSDPRQGYGFALTTGDSSVDLLAMAESTAEGEYLTPTRSDATVKAVKELGDYVPAYLPEGYVEQGTAGSPLENGGGWYSYVRKWFVNRAENTRIYFEYESYRIVEEDGYSYDPEAACACYMPKNHLGERACEETEINGMFGYTRKDHIAWADPEKHVVFHLFSEDVTPEELLEVAQSIFLTE